MQADDQVSASNETAHTSDSLLIEEGLSDQPFRVQKTVAVAALARVRQGIIHVRIRRFFCTLAEKFDPSLLGQAFVIGTGSGRPGEPGRVIDASLPAIRQSILPGMSLRRAYRLAPKIRFLPASLGRYQPTLQRLRERYQVYSRIVESVAPTDCFIDLQGCQLALDSPPALAQQLCADITNMGLTPLIGLAQGKAVAELAALVSRKDGRTGVCCVPPGSEIAFVQTLPLSLLAQVRLVHLATNLAPSTPQQRESEQNQPADFQETELAGISADAIACAELVAHLKDFGITTFAQVASLTEEGLRRRLGPAGAWLYHIARGEDRGLVVPDAPPLSQNARVVFPHPADADETCAAIRTLANHLGERLRSQRLKGQALSLVLWPQRSMTRTRPSLDSEEQSDPPAGATISARLLLARHSDEADVIAHHALMLFAQHHHALLHYTQAQLRIGDIVTSPQAYSPPAIRSRGKMTRKL